jgi:hypothetical protein
VKIASVVRTTGTRATAGSLTAARVGAAVRRTPPAWRRFVFFANAAAPVAKEEAAAEDAIVVCCCFFGSVQNAPSTKNPKRGRLKKVWRKTCA